MNHFASDGSHGDRMFRSWEEYDSFAQNHSHILNYSAVCLN